MSDTVAVAQMDSELWRRIRAVLDSDASHAIKTKLIDTLIAPPPTPAAMAAGDITDGGLWLTAAEVVARGGRKSIKAVQVAACQLKWRKKGGGKGKKALYWHEDALRPLGRPGRKDEPAPTQRPDPREPLLQFLDIDSKPLTDHFGDNLVMVHCNPPLRSMQPETRKAVAAVIKSASKRFKATPRPSKLGIGDGVEYDPPAAADRYHFQPPAPIRGSVTIASRKEMQEVPPIGRRVERIIEVCTAPDADASRTPGAVRHITFVKD